MFELNASIIDAIVFAMEDQEGQRRVNVENGQVILPTEDAPGADLYPPPGWSSREGYRLMETFVKTVRNPEVRHELAGALNRGRGVFKAFKECLAASPETEKAFHDYKMKAMRSVIRAWYDDLREVRGLERLGPEPDDLEDLVAADLGIRMADAAVARAHIADLAEAAREESVEVLPEALAHREGEIVAGLLAGDDWRGAWIEDGENGAIACIASRREGPSSRCFGRIFFLYVLPEFRRGGMGRALVSAMGQEYRKEGTELLVLDSAYLPVEFARGLGANGLSAYGARGFFRF